MKTLKDKSLKREGQDYNRIRELRGDEVFLLLEEVKG